MKNRFEYLHQNFCPPDNLRSFAKSGDLRMARVALRLELEDRRLDANTLKATKEWMKAQIDGLFEPLASERFAIGMESDAASWTTKYYGLQIVSLKTNFSEERFDHLIEIRDYFRQQTVPGFEPEKDWSVTAASISATEGHFSAGQREEEPRTKADDGPPEGLGGALYKVALVAVGVLVVCAIWALSSRNSK